MTDSSRGYQQSFAELKRRHVFKVAAIYGAVAFGVPQVADPLATALGLPDSFLSLVVGLLLLGFPVALVLAWAFEVTPEGVQKAEPAAPGEIEAIVAQPASKRWVSGLLAGAVGLLVAVGSASAQGIGGVHEISELSEGVLVAQPRFGSANSTIIVADSFVVLVDTHSTPAGIRALLTEVATLTDLPVRYVVNTHWHGDHHGGNRALAEALAHPVTFVAHPHTRTDIAALATNELREFGAGRVRYADAARSYLERNERSDGTPISDVARNQIEAYIHDIREFVPRSATYEYSLPGLLITSGLTLHGGRRTVDVRYASRAAHTRGDLFVWLPEDRILVAGDLLTVPYVVPRSGYPAAYARTLRELATFDFEWIVPGHGPPVRRDRSLLLLMAEFMETVVQYVGRAEGTERSPEETLSGASSDPRIAAFESRIEWDAPGGMRFLDFDSLVRMTVDRALVEAAQAR